jgi:PAS domain S-box-containing protein
VWTAIIRIPWVAGFYERQNHVRVDDTAELPEAAAEYRELLESQGVRSTLVAPTLSGGRSMGRLAIESVGRPVAWSEDIVSLLSALSVVFSNAVSRAEAEEQLERLSAAVELSPSAVIIADPDGCIEYVNAKFASGSGWTQEEVIGSPWLMLTQDSDEVTGRLQDAVATVDAGGEWHGEILLRRRDGTSFWASQAISAIRDDDGTVAHYFTLIEDISELKRIQDDLEQARREAVVASEAKSDFLASMSHEIRTPMNAIIGMGELLAGTGLDETQSRYARIMTSAGESLLNLVNGVLDLSKIEAGHLEFEERVFDLPDVFVRTCEVMEFQARTKGIELVTSIAAGVPRHVLGDPERLRQVLVNLVGNAVKFTESGTVTVSVGVSADDAGELAFSVEDTGIAIPADRLALVFERFTQGDSSTTRRYGGTGLGLAISKALVELMGGTIRVESEIGRGTTLTFTARMPEAPAPTTAEAGPDRSRTDDDATRLLVAEDSDDNRLLVEHLLLDGPYDLTFVGDGGAAVDAVTAAGPGGFDLVLMDIQMPVMDGLDATRAIREWESRQQVVETPIVALTAYAMKGDADRILEAGCTGRLSKPIRQAGLIETIAIYARRGDHERR